MLFNSFTFALFLPIVFGLYWILPHKWRWLLILVASYYFYGSWNFKYIVLILITTFVSFVAALMLETEINDNKRKCIVALTAVLCFGTLFFFKYYNFAIDSVNKFLSLFSVKFDLFFLNVMLPVGISFYTFQTFSYVVDVYRRKVKAEPHFGKFAAFISFFPQLVAGPIERTENLLPQIKKCQKFDYNKATYGLKLIAWGYFKKIVVADTLAVYVSEVYDLPTNFQGFSLVLATLMFSIQIYCDFSGYSDIAIGTANLFGIDLMKNFRSPYFSKSIKEFWSRWHISLSTWFRDYLYIPLGGNRVSKFRCNMNLLVTFLVSGLWHGANWTFVIWGALHGTAQVVEKRAESALNKYRKIGNVKNINLLKCVSVYTFCSFAWIFFVSNSIQDAIYVIKHMLVGINDPVQYLHNGFSDIGMGKISLILICLHIAILALFDGLSLKGDVIKAISNKNKAIRWSIYICFITYVVVFSQKGVAAEFVYFQF